jgi:signal transduction histidine kinase
VLDVSEIETEHVDIQSVAIHLRSVADACLDLVRPTAEAKSLTLALSIAAGVPADFLSDPKRLRQMLVNLLGYAVRFTQHGGVELRLLLSPDRKRSSNTLV